MSNSECWLQSGHSSVGGTYSVKGSLVDDSIPAETLTLTGTTNLLEDGQIARVITTFYMEQMYLPEHFNAITFPDVQLVLARKKTRKHFPVDAMRNGNTLHTNNNE